MKSNKELISNFTINYKRKTVTFSPVIFNKKVMNLKEFAITVLGIEALSTEIVAMYIGKLSFDTYNKDLYEIKILKKTKNGVKGTIKYNERVK